MSENIELLVDSFVHLVNDCLDQRKPLSVIRYGDGETMMFNDKEDDTAFILKKVLGYVPSNKEIQDLRTTLKQAYIDCDVIGIPTERHLQRQDNWGTSLIHFKNKVGEKTLHSKLRTSVDIFYDMVQAKSFIDLFAKIDTINYISCRNLDNVFKDKFDIKTVNSFIISPEPTYTSGYQGDKHYPEQFNQIKEWIKTLNCKGQLCLVGAGIPGKIYNNWFRDQGGVSLDIGSVFDAFAGFKTRGAGRGLDVIDETNKL